MATTTKLSTLTKRVRIRFEDGARLDWSKQDDWQQNANGYRVTLLFQGRRYSFDFWQGVGISDDPTVEGCLDCLLSDATAGEMSFDEFCAEFGYSTDSRRAERIWKQCVKARKRLQRLLGCDFESFVYAERD